MQGTARGSQCAYVQPEALGLYVGLYSASITSCFGALKTGFGPLIPDRDSRSRLWSFRIMTRSAGEVDDDDDVANGIVYSICSAAPLFINMNS